MLLYELLTGTTPLERTRLREAAYSEILRRIREEEPPRPSTRLSEPNEALATIAAQRQTEPARLAKLVRGELDWIVMKALEKDRTRRYETANGLARDIQRYLDGEPVEAVPAVGGLPAAEVRPQAPGGPDDGGGVRGRCWRGRADEHWQAVRARSARQEATKQSARPARNAGRAERESNWPSTP